MNHCCECGVNKQLIKCSYVDPASASIICYHCKERKMLKEQIKDLWKAVYDLIKIVKEE